MTDLRGEGVGSGVATGTAFWLGRSRTAEAPTGRSAETGCEPAAERPPESDRSAKTDRSPKTERERFETARERVAEELRAERERASTATGDAGTDVLAAHEALLSDPAFEERVESAVTAGESAERAVGRALGDWIDTFEERGGRTAARADDLRDVRGRLLRALGRERGRSVADAPAGAVILAERLTPRQAVRLDPDRVAGVATVAGSPIAHAAIVARSRGVPAVVGVGDGLEAVETGTEVAVDATDGRVVVAPESETLATDADAAVSARPRTQTGTALAVTANVGSGREAATASERGADGVGLFRSEVLAFRNGAIPDEDEQVAAYAAALDAFPGGRVAVRTFDFGGDKPFSEADEDDSRGVVRSLATPDLLRTQLRAACRAAIRGAGELTVVLPHVTRVSQVTAVRDHLAAVLDDLADAGVPHAHPNLGVMVETPAAVELAPDIAGRVASLSLGTNDLARYVLGVARDADPSATEPAVLRAIERTVDAATDAGVPVRCCGEMAADPDLAALLVGFGVTEVSVAPDAVPAVKRRLDGLDPDAAATLAARAVEASTNDEVDALLTGER